MNKLYLQNFFLFLLLFTASLTSPFAAQAQDGEGEDIEMIGNIYDNVLLEASCYDWLHFLCKNVGGRIAGSPEGAAAERYVAQMLDTMGVDSVWMQPVEVNYWRRGKLASARVINSQIVGTQDLSIAALGFSAATPKTGVTAEVIKVANLSAFEKLTAEQVKGKIVFFNAEMDPTKINTFHAYGGAVSHRTSGPRKASEKGAVAVIVRSMTLKRDDVPHSGVTSFNDAKPIPAVAIGMQSADLLADLLDNESGLKLNLRLDCADLGKQIANNVIGEIKGSKYPNEIIVVGGHLDSWDIGEGAHDDGAGSVQSMEVLNTFLRLGIRPQRTIRCVLFANEENGMFGATEYARLASKKNENHIAAVESDAGGHAPRGFTMDAKEGLLKAGYKKAQEWRALLAPYGLYYLKTGGSAADISRLKSHGAVLFGYRPDSQRYFDYHHSENDVFENIHKRELELGAAGMAALIYLIDKHGFKK